MTTNERRKRKEEILKIYLSLRWGDKIPSCCFEEKLFKCPDCGKWYAIWDLEIGDMITNEDILNDQVCCSSCAEGTDASGIIITESLGENWR